MDESDLTTVRAQARVGTLLNGRWHLDKLVGVGGMAAVYAATHRNTKRVAIKVLHPEISADDNARQRFLREGYAANQVGHRGAVSADDDGMTDDGVAFLVMELLEGESVEERSVRQGGRLKAREVLALMSQVLSTLEAAHAKGIVHRDLKPENLFLTHDGVVKVLDFGIARVNDQSQQKSPSQTQGIMGTPSFMAPEQARGRWEEVDQRTNLWAIGATMFSLLSGRCVHEAQTANEALVMAVTERAPALLTVLPTADPAVATLVDRALAYERELRFQTATEFRDALHAADAAIAGDESQPSLRVPKRVAPSPTQPGALALTTGRAVASSISLAQTRLDTSRAPRSKAPLALLTLALAGAALFVLVGRGLSHGAGKPPPFASSPTASAPAVVAAAAVATAEAPLFTTSAAPSPATSALSAPPTPKPTAKVSRPVAARSALSAAKPASPKPSVDLLKKRH